MLFLHFYLFQLTRLIFFGCDKVRFIGVNLVEETLEVGQGIMPNVLMNYTKLT